MNKKIKKKKTTRETDMFVCTVETREHKYIYSIPSVCICYVYI